VLLLFVDALELLLLLLVDDVGIFEGVFSIELYEFFEGEFTEFDVGVGSVVMVFVFVIVVAARPVLVGGLVVGFVVVSVVVLAVGAVLVVRLIGAVLLNLLPFVAVVAVGAVLVTVIVLVAGGKAEGRFEGKESPSRHLKVLLWKNAEKANSGLEHQLMCIYKLIVI
jgi:hypothetical protein